MMPCLWFNKEAEEAANFYVTTISNSRILEIVKSPVDWPNGKAGDVIVVNFEVNGQKLMALNGGPEFKFTEAISMSIECETQAEIDDLWTKLTANGEKKFSAAGSRTNTACPGKSQPSSWAASSTTPTKAKAARAFTAMTEMIKIDIATIERAAEAKAA